VSGRSHLRWFVLFATLLALGTAAPRARAELFRLGYDETGADPAEGFDEACLGDSPAEDCDVRAALIEAELVTLLSRLDSDRDPQTLALFQSALELDSPVVRAMAARYVARRTERPSDFLSKVKTFFWGPDAPLGGTAADILKDSPEDADARLVELFEEQRPSEHYAPQPFFEEETPAESPLLLACTDDTRLELMSSFSEEQVFEPARRLLMYDRFVFSTSELVPRYAVTAFLTDESVDDVADFFRGLFGAPLPPIEDATQRLEELQAQVLALQGAAASGDPEAFAEITRLAEELGKVQEQILAAGYLQLESIHAEKDLVFLDGTLADLASGPVRAVTVGHDDVAGGTVIRYVNAPSGQGRPLPGEGDGGRPGDDDEDPSGEGGAADRPTKAPDDGCGCSVPGHSPPLGWLAALPLAAWLARRYGALARRSKSSASSSRSPAVKTVV
jgi:hypothetical protein